MTTGKKKIMQITKEDMYIYLIGFNLEFFQDCTFFLKNHNSIFKTLKTGGENIPVSYFKNS